MKPLRCWIPGALLAMGLSLSGCILTSAQILATFDLTNPLVIADASSVEGVVVDLNTISDYEDHKDKLKGVLDLALLGEFVHVGGNAVNVDVWMTPGASNHTTAAAVMANGVKVWGSIALPVGGTVRIGWDESAKLFNAAGKQLLIQEIRGDGEFTVYALGGGGLYAFRINSGAFAVILDAGI